MWSAHDFLLEFAATGFTHKNDTNFDLFIAALCRLFKIALGPGRDHIGHIDRIVFPAQQMIGAGERHKAFGVLCSDENTRGILDTDDVVCGRVEHQ